MSGTSTVIDTEEILSFWFGDLADGVATADAKSSLWWGKDPATDSQIRSRFANSVLAVTGGRFDRGEKSARDVLALILLVDQFSRNIWRNDPRAFAHDKLARKWCHELLDGRRDRQLRPIERVFAYLPLEHSENIDDQNQCVALFGQLLDEQQQAAKKLFAGFLDYALAHQKIIARFGRFPHRNEILGRATSDEERKFLAQPGSAF